MPKQSKHKNSEKGKVKVLKSSQRAKPKARLIKKSANRKMVDFSVFYEDYVPPKLVVRDKQVEQIKQTLDNFAKNGISSNLQLQGVTGSGKTSTLLYVLKNYDPKLYTLIKCKQIKGIKEVLAVIAGIRPLARQRAPEVMFEAIKALKKDRRVIILDDVTAIPSWQELMGYLDGIFREVQSPIIVTTNVFKFLEQLPEDVRHTLLFFRVDFPAYNAIDLYNIIKDRVKLAGARFPDSSLHQIAAYAAQVGSARDALTMTRTAIQQNKTDPKAISELQRIMEEQTYLDYVSKLAPKERQVLTYIIERYTKERKGIPVRDITKDMRLSPSRTSQLVTGLEQYEVIQTRMEHAGGGNYRVIELDETLADKVANGEINLSKIST
ncbi:MAG: hypothetical protein QXO39_07000 [Conexivisphaerales archaeon]